MAHSFGLRDPQLVDAHMHTPPRGISEITFPLLFRPEP